TDGFEWQDPEVVDAILGKPDAVKMKGAVGCKPGPDPTALADSGCLELVSTLQEPNIATEDMVICFQDLEMVTIALGERGLSVLAGGRHQQRQRQVSPRRQRWRLTLA